MHSIEAALAIDFFRRGAAVIPLVLLVMLALPLWLFEAFARDGALDSSQREAVALHVVLTLIMGFGGATAVFQAHGRLARFFARPISAARLVACQMGLGIATIMGMYLIAVGILNLRGVDWPVLGPTLFLATTLACALAAVWSLEGSVIGQLIGCTMTTVPLAIWFSRCYGARIMGDWHVMWRHPTAAEALTLSGITAAAFVVAVFGVTRVRRGDQWDFATLKAWWEARTVGRTAPAKFRGPLAAQLWSEQRAKLAFVPAVLIAGCLLFPASLWMGGRLEKRNLLELIVALPMMGLMFLLPLVFGFVLGVSGGGSGRREMKHFLATRPVTDRFLATSILSNAAISLAWAWGVWLVGWLLIAGGVSSGSEWSAAANEYGQMLRDEPRRLLPFLAFPLISWTLTALMASLSATGRPWLWFILIGATSGVSLVFSVLNQWVEPDLLTALTLLYFAAGGAIFTAGTAWAFVVASRSGLLTYTVAAFSAAIFVVVVGTIVYFTPPQRVADALSLWHGAGLLALTFLPFAAMPLAVRWNRHR